MIPFGNMYDLGLTNSVPTHWPTCVPTYCLHIGQHLLILAIHLFDHLDLLCRDMIRNIKALEVFLCFLIRILLH